MSAPSVYLDHNATTPLRDEVKQALLAALEVYGNPSSLHSYGRQAMQLVEQAREQVAALLGAHPEEVIFTGGGSESNNTVLKMLTCDGVSCRRFASPGREIITSAIEHPSVLQTVQFLKGRGATVHVVGVDETGRVDMDQLRKLLSSQTVLVSIMLANNEIGTLQDIRQIADLAHQVGAFMHTDAVQGLGKIPVDVAELGVDYLSCSAHKIYGPKGVGALYVRKGAPYCVLLHGGHQEEGRRAGTINAPGIAAFGKAAELARTELNSYGIHTSRLRDRLRDGIAAVIPDVRFNGHPQHALPNTLNVSFPGAEGEAILLYLDLEGIAASTGSACASGSLDPSHVLLATGVGPELAHGSIRFSMGYANSEQDMDYVLEKLPPLIARIRSMSTVAAGGSA